MAQRDQFVVTVARSDEGEADVVPPESVHNLIRYLQDESTPSCGPITPR